MADQDLLQKIHEAEEEEQEDTTSDVVEENEETSLAIVEQSISADRLQNRIYSFLKLPSRQRGLTIPAEQAMQLKSHVAALRTGSHAAVPLVCAGGLKCPFANFCPLTTWDDSTTPPTIDPDSPWPVMDQCPVESLVMEAKMLDYIDEYDVKDGDITDLAIISKLVELDIYDHRLSMNLASDEAQGLVVDSVANTNMKTGDVYYEKKVHPALEAKLALDRRRAELLRAMAGTRREKIKLHGDKNVTDAVRLLSDLQRRINQGYTEEEIEGEIIEETRLDE